MNRNTLPDGVREVVVTRYAIDGLDGSLFESPEAAARQREKVLEARALIEAVRELMTLLKPGPDEPGKFVKQNPVKVEEFREGADKLLLGVRDTNSDWERLVKKGPMGFGKMPLGICVLIQSEEEPLVQPLRACYLRLARIDKKHREWQTPKEAEENAKK